MILPIYIYGQPVLREVSKDIDPADKEQLLQLTQNMYDTLAASGGIGLAAPQIGKAIRLVVIDLDIISDDLPEYKGFRHAFYNAHILEYSEETEEMEEGCLSLPGISEKVKRSVRIRVKYLDDQFMPHEEWVSGYLARVMRHEYDHRDGNVFTDHISPFRRQMIKSKLNAFLKGKARCSYKVKTIRKS